MWLKPLSLSLFIPLAKANGNEYYEKLAKIIAVPFMGRIGK